MLEEANQLVQNAQYTFQGVNDSFGASIRSEIIEPIQQQTVEMLKIEEENDERKNQIGQALETIREMSIRND